MTMEPEIAAYLQHNVAPSEPTIAQIKEILREPSITFSNIQEELRKLEILTQSLKQQEEQVLSFMKPYETILAPVRRIPPDILHEIFYHCLATHRNPIMDITEAPMLLTRICSSWRSTALSSPRIWSKLHIQYPALLRDPFDQFIFGPPTSKPNLHQDRITRSRSKLIKISLDRSGDCPLSMTIVCHQHLEEPTPGTASMAILEAFLPYIRRSTTLELIVTSEFYETLKKYVSTDALPLLETLRLTVNHEKLVEHQHDIHGVFLRAPKLKRLSLNSQTGTIKFPKMPPIWNHLTYLYFHSGLPETHLFSLLSQCFNLTTCRLSVWKTEQSYEIPASPIPLPFLHTFIVHDAMVTSRTMSTVCKAIQAPLLRRLHYARINHQIYAPFHSEEVELPILHLLEASPVEGLMLVMDSIPDDQTFSEVLK